MLGFGHSRGGRRAYRGTIDSPRGESIFATGVPKSIIWHALARQCVYLHTDLNKAGFKLLHFVLL